jgi:hypothetical protein
MKSFTSWLLRISGSAALAAILATTAQAESLGGTVTYGTTGVPSAVVSAYETTTGRKAVTRTNSVGAYLFRNLPSGKYVVLVEKDGRRIYQGKVDVKEQATKFDIRL